MSKFFKNVNFLDVDIKDKARDINVIETQVAKSLDNLELNSIHLNYTGGTKSMGIGAFLSVEKHKSQKKYFTDINS